jgi:hypothetical protein
VPDTAVGVVTERLGQRKGRMTDMGALGSGRTRLIFRIPSRGLVGFRSEFLTITRGEGILSTQFDGYEPWFGYINKRLTGALVADREGESIPYAIFHVQERGQLFIGPNVPVYQGMIIGENPKPEDIEVNICREKKLTNIRAAGRDENVISPRPADDSREVHRWIAPDELVEVTPKSIRLRKKFLNSNDPTRWSGPQRELGSSTDGPHPRPSPPRQIEGPLGLEERGGLVSRLGLGLPPSAPSANPVRIVLKDPDEAERSLGRGPGGQPGDQAPLSRAWAPCVCRFVRGRGGVGEGRLPAGRVLLPVRFQDPGPPEFWVRLALTSWKPMPLPSSTYRRRSWRRQRIVLPPPYWPATVPP